MVTKDTEVLFGMARHYKNGILLNSGGLADQPNVYMQAMAMIEGVQ